MDDTKIWEWFKVIVSFIWSLICISFVYLLCKNLICKDHKYSYVKPNKPVIITSILVPILFNIQALFIFSVCTIEVIGISPLCNPTATNHFYFDMSDSAIYHCARFTFYLYLIFNLENHIQQNDIMRRSIPRKFTKFVKIFVITLFTEVILVLTRGSSFVTAARIPYRLIHDVIYIAANLFLMISIMGLYSYGLHVFATYWNKKEDVEYQEHQDTERTHELLKIVTRCSISFGYSMLFDIISVTLNVIYYYGFKDDATENVDLMWRMVVNLAYLVNCISFVVSVYFSHEFGHEMYEKFCMKQDKMVNEYCSEINRDRTQNVGLEYHRMVSPPSQLQSDNEAL